MRRLRLLISGIMITRIVLISVSAQPFTKKYIMSFHTCDASCTGFNDRKVNLSESNDGTNWSLVPNFISYNGSVPDVIIRKNKLYLYNPGKVKRYDNTTGMWDTNTSFVSIVDSVGGQVQFVDPSAYIDSAGRIVLFFLNSTGNPMGQDPAGCQTYPCTKYFDSATEVDGSEGTQFVNNSNHRISMVLNSGTASDPDIFYDGNKYIMYISKGGSIFACQSDSLHGAYTAMPNLSNGLLTSQGGVPCGYYDPLSKNYWTYVHSNISGSIVIKQAIHPDFNNQLNTFTTVLSGPLIGQPSTTTTESPGFCVNDLLMASLSELSNSILNIYPNPATDQITVELNSNLPGSSYTISDLLGRTILKGQINSINSSINISELTAGVYILMFGEQNPRGFKMMKK